MRRTLAVPFLLLLSLSTFVACSGGDDEATPAANAATIKEPPPLPADVQALSATAQPTTTASTTDTAAAAANAIVATGEFVSPVRSELAAKVVGRVARLYVDEGSRVTKGQPVLELESDYLRLNLRAAEAETARLKALEDEAARDLARKQELLGKNSIPRATFDRSQAMFEQAQAGRAAANAQSALLRQQIADSTLRSPITGIVAEKRTDVGAKLGDGGVAFVVVQLSPLKLRFQIPERYLGKVEPGDRVSARVDPYAGELFEGTIKTVGGVIDPQTRTMFAEAEFLNRDGRLRPGLFARVEVKLD